MRAHDAVDDEAAHVGGVVAAVLEVVQRTRADREPVAVGLVPLGNPRVEVPAVVVEPRRIGESAHLVECPTLQLAEADDHVGHLHAGIVDVVLGFDRRAAEAQHAHHRVAQRRVAQVPDVRRLVRIDGSVLDDRLRFAGRLRLNLSPQPLDNKRGAIEKEIQIAVGRRDDSGHTGNLANGRRQVLGDRARRAPQRPRELKRDGDGQVAQRSRRRQRPGERVVERSGSLAGCVVR